MGVYIPMMSATDIINEISASVYLLIFVSGDLSDQTGMLYEDHIESLRDPYSTGRGRRVLLDCLRVVGYTLHSPQQRPLFPLSMSGQPLHSMSGSDGAHEQEQPEKMTLRSGQ